MVFRDALYSYQKFADLFHFAVFAVLMLHKNIKPVQIHSCAYIEINDKNNMTILYYIEELHYI